MSKQIHKEIIQFEKLSTAERQKVADEIYEVSTKIFKVSDRKELDHLILAPTAIRTHIQLLRDQKNELVGFCATHFFEVPIEGQNYIIFRAQAGILKNYRGAGLTFKYSLREAIQFKFKNPFKKVFLFCTLVHPSSYHVLADRVLDIYPGYKKITPQKFTRLMTQLADFFEAKLTPEYGPEIRDVGLTTIDDSIDLSFWQNSTKRDIQLFRTLNPGYTKGYGLVTILPFNLKNIIYALIREAVRSFKKKIEKIKSFAALNRSRKKTASKFF